MQQKYRKKAKIQGSNQSNKNPSMDDTHKELEMLI